MSFLSVQLLIMTLFCLIMHNIKYGVRILVIGNKNKNIGRRYTCIVCSAKKKEVKLYVSFFICARIKYVTMESNMKDAPYYIDINNLPELSSKAPIINQHPLLRLV